MQDFLVWLSLTLHHYPLAAPIVFIVVHVLLATLFLPCSPMTLMAGALWGGVNGLGISIFAAIVSSATTFILSRSFFHAKIEKFSKHRYPKVSNLLAQAVDHDWKIIAVFQINPLMPASTMGYAFGLSQITFKRYLLFSSNFMIPLQILFVMTGDSLFGLLTSDGNWWIAIVLFLLVVIILLVSKRLYGKLCQLIGVKNEF